MRSARLRILALQHWASASSAGAEAGPGPSSISQQLLAACRRAWRPGRSMPSSTAAQHQYVTTAANTSARAQAPAFATGSSERTAHAPRPPRGVSALAQSLSWCCFRDQGQATLTQAKARHLVAALGETTHALLGSGVNQGILPFPTQVHANETLNLLISTLQQTKDRLPAWAAAEVLASLGQLHRQQHLATQMLHDQAAGVQTLAAALAARVMATLEGDNAQGAPNLQQLAGAFSALPALGMQPTSNVSERAAEVVATQLSHTAAAVRSGWDGAAGAATAGGHIATNREDAELGVLSVARTLAQVYAVPNQQLTDSLLEAVAALALQQAGTKAGTSGVRPFAVEMLQHVPRMAGLEETGLLQALVQRAAADLPRMSRKHVTTLLQAAGQLQRMQRYRSGMASDADRALQAALQLLLEAARAQLCSGAPNADNISVMVHRIQDLAQAGVLQSDEVDRAARVLRSQVKQSLLTPGDVTTVVSAIAQFSSNRGSHVGLSEPVKGLMLAIEHHIAGSAGHFSADQVALLLRSLCALGYSSEQQLRPLVMRLTQQVHAASPAALVSAAAAVAQAQHADRALLFAAISHRVVAEEGTEPHLGLNCIAATIRKHMTQQGMTGTSRAAAAPPQQQQASECHLEQAKAAGRVHEAVDDPRTTLMLRNIPNTMPLEQVVTLLHRLPGCAGQVDFLYMPYSRGTGKGALKLNGVKGYALINMASPAAVAAVIQGLHGKPLLHKHISKVAAVEYARVQGRRRILHSMDTEQKASLARASWTLPNGLPATVVQLPQHGSSKEDLSGGPWYAVSQPGSRDHGVRVCKAAGVAVRVEVLTAEEGEGEGSSAGGAAGAGDGGEGDDGLAAFEGEMAMMVPPPLPAAHRDARPDGSQVQGSDQTDAQAKRCAPTHLAALALSFAQGGFHHAPFLTHLQHVLRQRWQAGQVLGLLPGQTGSAEPYAMLASAQAGLYTISVLAWSVHAGHAGPADTAGSTGVSQVQVDMELVQGLSAHVADQLAAAMQSGIPSTVARLQWALARALEHAAQAATKEPGFAAQPDSWAAAVAPLARVAGGLLEHHLASLHPQLAAHLLTPIAALGHATHATYDAVSEAILRPSTMAPAAQPTEAAATQQAPQELSWGSKLTPAAAAQLVWAYGTGAATVTWRKGELGIALANMVLQQLPMYSGPDAVRSLWGLSALHVSESRAVDALVSHLTRCFDLRLTDLLSLHDALQLQQSCTGTSAGSGLTMPAILAGMLCNAAAAAGLGHAHGAWQGWSTYNGGPVSEQTAARVNTALEWLRQDEQVAAAETTARVGPHAAPITKGGSSQVRPLGSPELLLVPYSVGGVLAKAATACASEAAGVCMTGASGLDGASARKQPQEQQQLAHILELVDAWRGLNPRYLHAAHA